MPLYIGWVTNKGFFSGVSFTTITVISALITTLLCLSWVRSPNSSYTPSFIPELPKENQEVTPSTGCFWFAIFPDLDEQVSVLILKPTSVPFPWEGRALCRSVQLWLSVSCVMFICWDEEAVVSGLSGNKHYLLCVDRRRGRGHLSIQNMFVRPDRCGDDGEHFKVWMTFHILGLKESDKRY